MTDKHASCTYINAHLIPNESFMAYGDGFKLLLHEAVVKECMFGEKFEDMMKKIYQPGALKKLKVKN